MEKVSLEIEILDKMPLEKGVKFKLNKNENFQIIQSPSGPQILVSRVESKVDEITLSESDKKIEKIKQIQENELDEELKELYEFKRKWQIKPGLWYLHEEKGLMSLSEEEELYFETNTSKELLKLLRTFFNNHHKMVKYKRTKRSYLLHSDPGMGKSALIRYFCREALKTEGTSVVKVGGDMNFALLQKIFLMEYDESVKFIILVIEDFGKKDYAMNQNIYNPSCLNFLDGNIQLFRVPTLILTTTNFAKELGSQLTSRPGRFSQIIKVSPPTNSEVIELVESYLNRQLDDEEKKALAGKAFSPDYCLEAVIRSELGEMSIKQAIDEIVKERQGLVDWNK